MSLLALQGGLCEIVTKRFRQEQHCMYRRSTPSVFHGFAKRSRGRSDHEVKMRLAKSVRVRREAACANAFASNKMPLAMQGAFCSTGGRSDVIRTRDIEVPNFARYQLRYTPLIIRLAKPFRLFKYIILFGICQVLLTIKVVNTSVGIKIGAEIPIR